MKSILKCVVLVAGMVVSAGAAQAQNWYGSFSGGLLLAQDRDVTVGTTTATIDLSTGYSFQGAVGYAFGNGFRTELELGYGKTGIDSISVGATTATVTGGDIDLLSGQVGAYYDFNVSSFTPYVGAGVGITNIDLGAATVAAVPGASSPSESATKLSMFGEVGASFALSESLDLVPAVRYMWLNTSEVGTGNTTGWVFKTGLRFKF